MKEIFIKIAAGMMAIGAMYMMLYFASHHNIYGFTSALFWAVVATMLAR